MVSQYLCIVSRDEPDLYQHLRGEFAADEEIEVLPDRRVADRRGGVQASQPERRRVDRRSQPGLDEELRFRGFAIARKSEGYSPSNAPGNTL